MPEISLRKLNTHYFLPGAERGQKARLDSLRMKVLGEAFGSLADRANLPPDGELCIRNVSAPVRLRLESSDHSVVTAWSSALAQNLIDIFRRGSASGQVFYYSRRHAIFDLVLSVSRGDYRRSWAWQLMGLFQSEPASERDAVSQLVAALCREAKLIVPALQLLAAQGSLPPLARRLSGPQWIELAQAAASAAEVSLTSWAKSKPESSRTYRRAFHVMRRSTILASVISPATFASQNETVGNAIATLAILEVEPALLHTERGPELLEVVRGSFTGSRAGTQALPDQTGVVDERSIVGVAQQDEFSRPGQQPPQNIRRHEKASKASDDRVAPLRSSKPRKPGLSTNRPVHVLTASPAPPDVARSLETAEADTSEVFDPRRKAFTEFGGLVFLIAIIEALKLPGEILNHATLGSRPLNWTLHQLALQIVPAGESDAAVLAFAGLLPDAKPPSKQEAPIAENEKDSLAAFRKRITDGLSEVIDYEARSVAELIEFVCCRRAQIVADPAWIEVRFSLDQVATEIRRAGLDLDPGYVSWLGIVLKFVYE